MYFIACDEPPTVSGAQPECASGWLVVPESVVVQTESPRITAEEFDALYGWICLLLVSAIGWRYLQKQLNSEGGRNA